MKKRELDGSGKVELGHVPTKKDSGSRALPEVARMVKRAKVKSLFRNERTLSAERYSQNTLVLGRVEAARTQALRLAERDLLPLEPGLDARVEHVNREAEASHRIPVGHSAHGPEVEAWIA